MGRNHDVIDHYSPAPADKGVAFDFVVCKINILHIKLKETSMTIKTVEKRGVTAAKADPRLTMKLDEQVTDVYDAGLEVQHHLKNIRAVFTVRQIARVAEKLNSLAVCWHLFSFNNTH